MAERGVRLLQRMIGGVPHLSLLLEPIETAGRDRSALEVETSDQIVERDLRPFVNLDCEIGDFVQTAQRLDRRLLQRVADFVERHRQVRFGILRRLLAGPVPRRRRPLRF